MAEVKEAKKIVKDLDSDKPGVAMKAAKIILTKVQKESKTLTVNLTSVRPEVTFTGEGWCAMDIKLSYAAIVRKFKENQRELYRKEYEKK